MKLVSVAYFLIYLLKKLWMYIRDIVEGRPLQVVLEMEKIPSSGFGNPINFSEKTIFAFFTYMFQNFS